MLKYFALFINRIKQKYTRKLKFIEKNQKKMIFLNALFYLNFCIKINYFLKVKVDLFYKYQFKYE